MTNYYPQQSVGPTDVGPYRLVRMIGEGGMGAVYYALRRSDNLAVALKILPRSLAMDSDQLARFRREAAVAMGLDHPNVVGCIDVDQADGYNFMVMEFVGGGDAEELLRRSGGRISERRAMSVTLDITKALHHASSFGLVHRDIKPENLLFTESGLAKLTDFGLVKRTAENLRITERGKAMGTPHFMAPEQARGKRDLDVRSDIYSLGATIYYLLSGHTPYNGNSAFEIVSQLASEAPPPLTGHRPDLSPSCLFIIECMMARELEDRPQSAKDLLVMIEAYFNGRQIPHPHELTKSEKPDLPPPVEPRKTGDTNPMKKLKAAEFQGTPKEPRQPDTVHELPANSITRHFLTSPTRILTKGGAAPPPPAPETVAAPGSGTKIPLFKQNADVRRPAAAQPSATPGGMAPPAAGAPAGPGRSPVTASILRGSAGDPKPLPPPPPPGVAAQSRSPAEAGEPAGLPVGIPVGIPVGMSGMPQAYQSPDESGEQIAADLDRPLPAVQFPPTPPAGTVTSRSTPPQPPTVHLARPETGMVRRLNSPLDTGRPPAPVEATGSLGSTDSLPVHADPTIDPFESGELISAEASPEPSAPPVPLQVPLGPGPVTARFRIQAPPPEAYIDSGEAGDLLQEEPSATEGAGYADAETPPPEAYLDSSGSEPQAAGTAGESPSEPVIESPTAEAADSPPQPALPPTFKAGYSGWAVPVVLEEPPQPELQTPPEMIQSIAMHVSSASTPAVTMPAAEAEAPPAEASPTVESSQSGAVITPPAGIPESTIQAVPTAETAGEAEAPPQEEPAPAVPETEPAPVAAMEPEPAQEAVVGVESPAPEAASESEFLPSRPDPVPSANAAEALAPSPEIAPVAASADLTAGQAQLTTETLPDSSTVAKPEEPVEAPVTQAPVEAAPPVAAVSEVRIDRGAASPGIPVTTAPMAAAPAAAEPETSLIDQDSLLARVRRLSETDTIPRDVANSAGTPAPQPSPAPVEEANSWGPVVLGFVGGVIVTIAIVLILQLLQ